MASLGLAFALVLMPLGLAFAGPVQVLAPVTEADGRLGLDDVLSGSPPGSGEATWGQLAYNAGARINRWEFRWDRIEPQTGTWNFSEDDPAVEASVAAGLQVDGILIGTPAWATVSGSKPGNSPSRGYRLPASDPGNLWATYVRTTVAHYKGQVHYWEVWNEPDLHFFWSGTPDQYYRMLLVADRVIKQVDPTAQVLMAGMVVPDLGFLTRVLDLAKQAGMAPFDIAAWHAYGDTRLLYGNLTRFRALLGGAGFGRTSLWVTEDGFPASNPTGEPRQAAYILQTIASALAAGADKILVYRESDDGSARTYGILSGTGAPRMGYVAFQVAARYLAGAQAAVYAPQGGLDRVELYEPGRRLTLVWGHSMQGQAVTLPTTNSSVTTIDWQGAATSVAAAGGQVRLQAPGAVYNAGIDPAGKVVGGPPLAVLEDNSLPVGLATASYVPALEGQERRLTLLNPSASSVDVDVEAASHPKERMAVHLAAGGLGSVDLDLLAGPAYHGAYAVASTLPVDAAAGSNRSSARSVQTSSDWYVPGTTSPISIRNPSGHAVRVQLTGYGAAGKVQMRVAMSVAPRGFTTWAPRAHGPTLAVALHGSAPVLASAADGGALPAAQSSWYLIGQKHPSFLFNPLSRSTSVNVRFVGAPTLRGEELVLGPHRSFRLSGHGARAVTVAADAPVALGGRASSEASTRTSVAVAGPATTIGVFNPSHDTAHLTLTTTTAAASVRTAINVAGSSVYTRTIRDGGAPMGAVIQSDVPVVTVAGP